MSAWSMTSDRGWGGQGSGDARRGSLTGNRVAVTAKMQSRSNWIGPYLLASQNIVYIQRYHVQGTLKQSLKLKNKSERPGNRGDSKPQGQEGKRALPPSLCEGRIHSWLTAQAVTPGWLFVHRLCPTKSLFSFRFVFCFHFNLNSMATETILVSK